jgi:hypothetical protein
MFMTFTGRAEDGREWGSHPLADSHFHPTLNERKSIFATIRRRYEKKQAGQFGFHERAGERKSG